ncbi:hypothetical protein Acr_15g0006960 [Actinidia rufa]|uniref:Uncharacterized protein n=1 Tax=Actinidia rufa TaxID=165716 RepID=A0A7J0FUH6_9ERIC|nr:hypothetical protein Acr_15g0006960 [Actinidia rufa]
MAKHSNTDPQVSNFSLLNSSLSQDLDTADSLSIPSEPPDIRNWFSSYVYESPELDTVGDFIGYGFRESGCVEERFESEENLGKFRKIRNKEVLVLGEKVASVGLVKSNNIDEDQNLGNTNSIQSIMFLSLQEQPSLICNLCSAFTCTFSGCRLEAKHRERLVILQTPSHFLLSLHILQDGFQAMYMNLQHWIQVMISKVLFLQKVNVRGWGVMLKTAAKKKEKIPQILELREVMYWLLMRKISSNGLVKCKSLDRDNKYDNQHNSKGIHVVEGNKMSSVLIEMPVETIPGPFLEGKPTRNSDYGSTSTQSGEKPSLDAQVSISKEGNNRESDVMCLNPNASRGWNNRKSPAKSTDRRDSAEVIKPTCGSNGKENDRKIFPENGFVSTRSDRSARPNDGSSLKRSGEGHFGGLRNRMTDSSVVGKEGILRKAIF